MLPQISKPLQMGTHVVKLFETWLLKCDALYLVS